VRKFLVGFELFAEAQVGSCRRNEVDGRPSGQDAVADSFFVGWFFFVAGFDTGTSGPEVEGSE